MSGRSIGACVQRLNFASSIVEVQLDLASSSLTRRRAGRKKLPTLHEFNTAISRQVRKTPSWPKS
jgi:hypothetical protein